MAAFVATNAKAIADPAPLPNPVPQRAGRIAPASAPLVLDAAKPYSFAYEVIDPLHWAVTLLVTKKHQMAQ